MSSSETAIVRVGENYDQVVEQLAMSAIDEESAKEIRATLKREKVLQDYALADAIITSNSCAGVMTAWHSGEARI